MRRDFITYRGRRYDLRTAPRSVILHGIALMNQCTDEQILAAAKEFRATAQEVRDRFQLELEIRAILGEPS